MSNNGENKMKAFFIPVLQLFISFLLGAATLLGGLAYTRGGLDHQLQEDHEMITSINSKVEGLSLHPDDHRNLEIVREEISQLKQFVSAQKEINNNLKLIADRLLDLLEPKRGGAKIRQ